MIEWNEENFDIDMNGYTRMCYAEKKYAYLSDYVRLWAVEKYGGIYLDTDVEVIRPLEKLLQEDAYFGFENKRYVNTGLGFGSAAHGAVLRAMLKEYDVLLDGKNGVRMCPELNTKALTALGLKQNGQKQKIWEAAVYPVNVATVYKGNIIKNLIMDCQSYTKYRPNETTGGIFVSWRRKEELPTGA